MFMHKIQFFVIMFQILTLNFHLALLAYATESTKMAQETKDELLTSQREKNDYSLSFCTSAPTPYGFLPARHIISLNYGTDLQSVQE